MEKYTGHYGCLKGIDIIAGEKYFFDGKVVILKEVTETISFNGNSYTEYWFQYFNSLLMFKVTEKELMKCADFKRYEERNNKPYFFKWRDNNKNTGFINNDMIDSLSYSLNNEMILGLKNNSFVEKTKDEIAKYIAEKYDKIHNLPRKVFFNDKKKATTLLYGDEATVVKTCKGDKYDREKGFLMAFFQKQSGLSKTKAKKYLKKITEEK
jgi:hypothetical protein